MAPATLILFRPEFQPNTTAFLSNCLFKLLAARDVLDSALSGVTAKKYVAVIASVTQHTWSVGVPGFVWQGHILTL
jgi:hypothetical protein